MGAYEEKCKHFLSDLLQYINLEDKHLQQQLNHAVLDDEDRIFMSGQVSTLDDIIQIYKEHFER